jgi:hypothetical protein
VGSIVLCADERVGDLRCRDDVLVLVWILSFGGPVVAELGGEDLDPFVEWQAGICDGLGELADLYPSV